jgi:kynurenine formamidase
MIRGGWTLDDCDLNQLCGEAAVIDVSDLVPSGAVNADVLERRGGHVKQGDLLILRSNLHEVHPNTTGDYWQISPYVDADGSHWIVDRGCRALVIDFPQDYVAREMGDRKVTNPEFTEHQIVLGANLMHLEHVVNLSAIQQERVFLVGWPLRLPGADGGPASPVALTEWPGPDPHITDLSLPITENWTGKVTTGLALSFENGDSVQESKVRFDGHSHTHVVTPKYVGSGPGVEGFIGAPLVRRADVADLSVVAAGEVIDAQRLSSAIPSPNPAHILLLRTDHTERVPYDDANWLASSPSIGDDAVRWIVDAGYKVIGADCELDEGRKALGGQPARKGEIRAEATLLEHGIVLVKQLCNMRKLRNENALVVTSPLNLKNAEAAPARVLALEW